VYDNFGRIGIEDIYGSTSRTQKINLSKGNKKCSASTLSLTIHITCTSTVVVRVAYVGVGGTMS
jgi:hypothetical protein